MLKETREEKKLRLLKERLSNYSSEYEDTLFGVPIKVLPKKELLLVIDYLLTEIADYEPNYHRKKEN